MSEGPYNPLDTINLGKSVAEALLDKTPDSLASIASFNGAGIYAIYYNGGFKPYRKLARRNADKPEWPIYIGKAIPSGGRKGASPDAVGRYLWSRLKDHADSVRAASSTLKIENFLCRYLIVEDIWIPLGETLLITRFKPLWNLALDGFGNHDPGAGRYNGLVPLWDVLHPGRVWAARCKARPDTPADVAKRVEDFLDKNEPPADAHMNFSPQSKS